MTTFVTQKQRGHTLLEFAVAAAVLAILVAVLLSYLWQYQKEAERVSLQITVANLRTALQIRVAEGKLRGGTQNLTMLAEENPFNWLKNKPVNYAGEFYSPADAQIGSGRWCFDRGDKSVVYLLNIPETFLDAQTKRLKFKVKLLRLLNTSGDAENTSGAVIGVDFEQVEA
jgi:general secretion pathway protein G